MTDGSGFPQPNAGPGRDEPPAFVDHVAAAAAVKAPAISMIVLNAFNLLYSAASYLFIGPVREMMHQTAERDRNFESIAKMYDGAWMEIVLGASVLLCVLGLVGAVRMLQVRNYAFVMITTILTMINLSSCCCLINLGLGIWALIVLMRDEVQAAFNRP